MEEKLIAVLELAIKTGGQLGIGAMWYFAIKMLLVAFMKPILITVAIIIGCVKLTDIAVKKGGKI